MVAFENLDRGIRLEVRKQDLLNGAGRAIANVFRRRLRKGVDGYGRKLPGENRWRNTGELIKALKWDPANSLIWFKGKHSKGGSDNAKIAAALTFGRIGGDYDSTGRVEPLLLTEETDRAAAAGVEKELAKQLKKGKARLVALGPLHRRAGVRSGDAGDLIQKASRLARGRRGVR